MLAPLLQDLPDIRSIEPDLAVPALEDRPPRAGSRVRHALAAYRGTSIYHVLYLPRNWRAGERYPVIAEYAGNGNYRNPYGDVSLGVPEGSNLGYGISGGEGFIWLCLPYVNAVEGRNQILWWGDPQATIDYCHRALDFVCRQYGGDPARLLLTGFSRGAIGCNYLGLRDRSIAQRWRAFFCYSHYDGVRSNWPYADADRSFALERLQRLRGRPQFICHERSVAETRAYLESTGIAGDFTLHDLPFRNHNDTWTLRDIPLRRTLRAWVQRVL